MPRRRDQRVWRAEFRDWIQPSGVQPALFKGTYAVEVARCPNRTGTWEARVADSHDIAICYRPTADGAKASVRRYFAAALTDWVVGEKVDGVWRPVDEARERQLSGAA